MALGLSGVTWTGKYVLDFERVLEEGSVIRSLPMARGHGSSSAQSPSPVVYHQKATKRMIRINHTSRWLPASIVTQSGLAVLSPMVNTSIYRTSSAVG